MLAIVSCENQADLAPLRQLMLNCGVECQLDDVVLLDNLMTRLNRGGAELLILAIGNQPTRAIQLLREIHEKNPLPVLILGPGDDASIILQAMQAGAREYVDIFAEKLQPRLADSLEKLRKSGLIQLRRGRSFVVTAAVPGSGVTTVACGLAFALGAKHPQQVLLAELDAGIPELALDLDLALNGTLGQLLRDWQRMDASALRQAIVEHPQGVHILAENYTSNDLLASVEAAGQLICLARTLYDHAVYDLGHGLRTPLAQQVVRTADRVLIVIRLDVPSLRLTRILLNRLANLGVPKEKLTLVGNRYGQRKQVDWNKAQESLGVPIDAWLPDDTGLLNQALNLGQPVTQLSSWAKMNKSLNALAKQLNGKKT